MSRRLPATGLAAEEVLRDLASRQAGDWPWREGRSFSLVYHAGDEHESLMRSAYGMYLAANGLSSRAFPSLAALESEVVAIVADLACADASAAGAMTSGGTESIILAMKAYRDRARAERGRRARCEIVLPRSVHPGFLKAAAYLDLEPVVVECGGDSRADAAAMDRACSSDTIALVASAPSFPHGVVDPIAELGEIARARGVGLHVDASLGGFVLPFLERMKGTAPAWDFRVPGVTSLSIDLHKFGYAAKGASVVLYRDAALRRYQFFATDQWSGGVFASPGVLGTRPGGAIAAAWAALHVLGEDGYGRLVERALDTATRLRAGIARLGLRVFGDPPISVFAFGSDGPPMDAIAGGMTARGWEIDRLQNPDSIHLIITAAHDRIVDPFLRDLESSVANAHAAASPGVPAPAILYGVTGDVAAGGDPISLAIAGLEQRSFASRTKARNPQ